MDPAGGTYLAVFVAMEKSVVKKIANRLLFAINIG
jgi:hypothetical protein